MNPQDLNVNFPRWFRHLKHLSRCVCKPFHLQTCTKIWTQIFRQRLFGEEVIDSLETYDFELGYDIEWDDEGDENVSANDGDLAKKLMFPYDKNEPNLSDEQLMELNSIADGIEIQRLTSMNVRLDSNSLEGVSYKQLSNYPICENWASLTIQICGKRV